MVLYLLLYFSLLDLFALSSFQSVDIVSCRVSLRTPLTHWLESPMAGNSSQREHWTWQVRQQNCVQAQHILSLFSNILFKHKMVMLYLLAHILLLLQNCMDAVTPRMSVMMAATEKEEISQSWLPPGWELTQNSLSATEKSTSLLRCLLEIGCGQVNHWCMPHVNYKTSSTALNTSTNDNASH